MAFILDSEMNLWEHQSTYNKELHEKYLKEDAREEGLAEGRAEGLRSAVNTAAMFTSDVKLIHAAVIKNEPYQDITLEQVEKILKGKA